MVPQEDGRWDVGIKSDAVCLERISDSDKRLFEDLLAPEEARQLAGLLTKYADKVDESAESRKSDDSDKRGNSDKSDNSAKGDDSGKSGESDKPDESDESEDPDEPEDSDKPEN